jgi:SPP1 gp7 family putative phage head morphogenesis protein
MVKQITAKELLAIDNVAILYQAKAAGMQIHPEDLFVRYAEMDLEITDLEDQAVGRMTRRMRSNISTWLLGIERESQVEQEGLNIGEILHAGTLDHIKKVWSYGSKTAQDELEDMEKATNGEIHFAAGVQMDSDVTNEDAYEWYDRYAKELGASGQDALFIKMQPLILQALEQGVVGTALAQMLTDDFARFGSVRADIIARTESTKAFNWGRRYRFDQSAALGGYRYSAIMDARTTSICRGLHGSSWTRDNPELDAYTPPNHYRCRSILVPISKYKDWDYKPPAGSWEDNLPEKEKEVLGKFKDASWSPKPSTVRAMDLPKAGAQKPKPKQPKAAAPAKDQAVEDRIKEIQDISHQEAIGYMDGLINSNVARGVSADHPTFQAWRGHIQDIQDGKYKDKLIEAEFNKRANASMQIKTYDRHGGVFLRKESGISKEDQNKLMEAVDAYKDDPLYVGLKVELQKLGKPDKKGMISLGSYNANDDKLVLKPYNKGKKSIINTHRHEIGHRVHNTKTLYGKSSYTNTLQKQGVTINDQQWDDFTKVVEPFWDSGRSIKGSKLLPDDMYDRWEYPINAPFHYERGTKANYQKEMFAEGTSVYLENDPDEIKKVKRTYPGLLEFLEGVYKRGHIKQ